MSKLLAAFLLLQISLSAATLSLKDWYDRHFNPSTVDVRPVQGISERVVDGKLHLNLKEFLELVLKNNTGVALTRLDIYTAANAITSAKAPFDPQFAASFQALRAISPQFTQISGAATLNGLTQTSTATYQQVLPTGQTVNAGFTAIRSSTTNPYGSAPP